MAKYVHKSLVRKKPRERLTLNLKVFPEEAVDFRKKAKQFTKGNFTQLCRLALAAYRPSKRELVRVR